MKLYFAYDASLHGDWVSRYALRLAGNSPDRVLHVLHVLDGRLSTAALSEKLARLETEAKAFGVSCSIQIEPLKSRGAYRTLRDALPPGPDTMLVCGTRIRQKRLGLLAGTVARRLLEKAPYNVLAIRVVQPGLLGHAHDFLIPVSGHQHGFHGGVPVLQLFAPGIAKLHVLHVIRRSPLWFRMLSAAAARRLLMQGRTLARQALREIEANPAIQDLADQKKSAKHGPALYTDARAVLSDDWAKEILIQANQLQARMILMGASPRTPARNSVNHFFDRYIYGNPLEQILRQSPCDVALFRSVAGQAHRTGRSDRSDPGPHAGA